MGMRIDFAAVDDLVETLRAAGIRSVDTDPAKVASNLPGVWVKVERFTLDFLAAYTITTTLYLVARDIDYTRGGKQLVDLFDQVTEIAEPSTGASIQTIQLAMPDGTVAPALSFPFDLYSTQETPA